MSTYQRGQNVRLGATFVDSNGALADPTTVTCKVRKTDGTILTQPAVVRESVGVYHVDILIDVNMPAGDWYYRFEGTAPVATAQEAKFTVSGSVFYPTQ